MPTRPKRKTKLTKNYPKQNEGKLTKTRQNRPKKPKAKLTQNNPKQAKNDPKGDLQRLKLTQYYQKRLKTL